MATLADLKRFLQIGQEIKLVYRNKKLDEPIPRIVTKIQTNGVYLKNPFDEKSKPSWLEFPKASLLSFDKTGIRIYTRGIRPLTQEEKEIREGYEKIRNKKQEEIDLLTDGSSSYYQETSYYKSKNAYYLMGNTFERGMKYDYNTGQVWDDNIRGNLTLEYVF